MQGTSEVLIVGAGPAGCAAGIVLARAGVDVCVVDRATFPRDKTCGDALSNDAVELLDRLGVRAQLDASPHALVHTAAALFPDGTRIAREYERPGYIAPRFSFDDCMRLALERSGAKLVQGVRVAHLIRDGERITGAEGPKLRWSAKLVIAADGYGSAGLSALGTSAPRGRALAVSATVYLRGVRFPHGANVADHYFEPELPFGYGWIFPAVDGVANVGVYLRADGYARAHEKLDALLEAFLARHADRVAGAERTSKTRVWSLPIAPRRMPLTAAGLMLVGDAAGFVDPLSGEGIWQGLHSGMLAGELAAQAVARGELSAELRARYEGQCDLDILRPSRKKLWVQDTLERVVQHRLYRSVLVRTALSLGYRHRALEFTKS
ncbi:MAG TPA: geranylgeranyl reductase family protein [Polyangiales bacterium]|nr:geranylgeranyl reductase family protein [Polyangiales bacterium]